MLTIDNILSFVLKAFEWHFAFLLQYLRVSLLVYEAQNLVITINFIISCFFSIMTAHLNV